MFKMTMFPNLDRIVREQDTINISSFDLLVELIVTQMHTMENTTVEFEMNIKQCGLRMV